MRLEFEPNVTAFPLVENEVFDHVSAFASSDFQTLMKNGISAAQDGDRVMARDLLFRATEIDSGNEDVWMWLASVSDYPEELLAFLDNVLDINPDNQRASEWHAATSSLLAKTFVQRGIDAHEQGDDKLANQCFEQALDNDSSCEMAWFWRASISGSIDEKIKCLKWVLHINPDNAEAQSIMLSYKMAAVQASLDQARSAAAAGDPEKAVEIIDEVLGDHPDNVDALMLRSHFSVNLNEKLHSLEQVLELDPDNTEAQSFMLSYKMAAVQASLDQARSVAAAGDPEKAVEIIDEVLGDHPDNVDALMLRSHFSVNLNEKLHSLEQVLELDPDNTEAQSFMLSYKMAAVQAALDQARSAAAAGDTGKANNIIGEVLCDHPDNVEALMLRSHFSADLNEKLGALEQVLEIEPDNIMARSSYDFLSTTLKVVQPVNHESETESDAGTEPSTPESVSMEPELSDDLSSDIDSIHTTNEPLAAADFAVVEEAEAAWESHPVVEIESPEPEREVEEFHMDEVSDFDPPATEQLDIHTTEEPVVAMNADNNQTDDSTVNCPFCSAETGPKAFKCNSCNASLSLSDIESLLSNSLADRDLIQTAVTEIEAQWNLREFDEHELTVLALGQFNLREFDRGLKYLQEASRLTPNDVILAGQVNALAIRLEEMRRQAETQSSFPTGRSILVVDDSATVRKLISGKLEKSGHNVDCAVDGSEGLAKITASKPDLVLLDIGMPGMDGYEVCKEIRANPETRDLPVVMISGKDGFFDKVRGKMAGATGYVTKPFGPETLMKALETYLSADTSSDQ